MSRTTVAVVAVRLSLNALMPATSVRTLLPHHLHAVLVVKIDRVETVRPQRCRAGIWASPVVTICAFVPGGTLLLVLTQR